MKKLRAFLILALLGSQALSQTSSPSSPDSPTVDRLLKDAEAVASTQHKNIFLIFSASWCAPCHVLTHFLAEPAMQPIFDRHFVTLFVNYSERPNDTRHQDTPGAAQLIDSLHDTDTSLPLIVILDSSGKPVVDSVLPVYGRRNIRANIGFPGSPTSIAWFLEMLRRGSPSLTQNELETIENRLRQGSTDGNPEPPANKTKPRH